MRFPVSICLVLALVVTSYASQGVVVETHSRPFPFYYSLGVERLDTFVLRDSAGAFHRQMVPPDVSVRYAVGDYFNDSQPGGGTSSDDKTMRTARSAALQPSTVASTPREMRLSSVVHDHRNPSSEGSAARKRNHPRHVATKTSSMPLMFGGTTAVSSQTDIIKKAIAKKPPVRNNARQPMQAARASSKSPVVNRGNSPVFIYELPHVR